MERLNSFKNEKERLYSDKFTHTLDKAKANMIFGNCSRFAKNWIAGPSNEVRQQHVPGYTGHIKGLIAENLHGDSFANCSSKAIYRKHPHGHDVQPKHRFQSTNQSQFVAKNFRRFGKYYLNISYSL